MIKPVNNSIRPSFVKIAPPFITPAPVSMIPVQGDRCKNPFPSPPALRGEMSRSDRGGSGTPDQITRRVRRRTPASGVSELLGLPQQPTPDPIGTSP